MELLKSLGINSHKGDGAVVISAQDSIKRAHEIGMFRYASDRRKNLEKLSKMIDSYDSSREITDAELEIIKEMRNDRVSWGAIAERLYDEFGYTLPDYTIRRRAVKLGID